MIIDLGSNRGFGRGDLKASSTLVFVARQRRCCSRRAGLNVLGERRRSLRLHERNDYWKIIKSVKGDRET